MDFFSTLMSIILVNILLSGDNALVIALASRSLPPKQQKAAILWGGVGAIALRILLTLLAVVLLAIPYLQLIGGILLQWVAIKLVTEDTEGHQEVHAAGSMWGAVKTILMADLVMSLDNVVAIAGVAKGNVPLLIIGLGISIPIIIWGSKIITALMQRWPLIIVIGAAFLGWTAGEMIVADHVLAGILDRYTWLHWIIPGVCAAVVVLVHMKESRKRMPGKE